MLRDLALTGSVGFSSDIDIVTTAPEHVLESAIAGFSPKKNRFGGYRFVVQGCSYDIWRLENTWAVKQGFAKVESFKDLLNTTFFNLDAIAYHLSEKKILTNKDYFSSLQQGSLEINLEANPNPSGMASRALRIVQFKDIALSPGLSEYVIKYAKQGNLGRANNLVLDALKEFHLCNPNAWFSLSAIAQMGWKQDN